MIEAWHNLLAANDGLRDVDSSDSPVIVQIGRYKAWNVDDEILISVTLASSE